MKPDWVFGSFLADNPQHRISNYQMFRDLSKSCWSLAEHFLLLFWGTCSLCQQYNMAESRRWIKGLFICRDPELGHLICAYRALRWINISTPKTAWHLAVACSQSHTAGTLLPPHCDSPRAPLEPCCDASWQTAATTTSLYMKALALALVLASITLIQTMSIGIWSRGRSCVY